MRLSALLELKETSVLVDFAVSRSRESLGLADTTHELSTFATVGFGGEYFKSVLEKGRPTVELEWQVTDGSGG